MSAGLKKMQTKNKRVTNTGLKKSGKEKKISDIKLKTSNPETFNSKSLSSTYKSNADSYEERKQSGLVDVGINLDLECDLDKSFDSQDTISEEMTETEFSDVMSKPKSEKGKRRIVRTSPDSADFIHPTVMKSQSVHKMLKDTSKRSLCSYSSLELKSQGNVQPQCSNPFGIQMNLKKLRLNQVRTFRIPLVQLNLQVRRSLQQRYQPRTMNHLIIFLLILLLQLLYLLC